MAKYRVRSKHAIDLPGGKVAAPRDVVELSARSFEVKQLEADGVLLRLKTPTKRGTK